MTDDWDWLLKACYDVRSPGEDWSAVDDQLGYRDTDGDWNLVALFRGDNAKCRAHFCAYAYEWLLVTIEEIKRLAEENERLRIENDEVEDEP